MTDDDKKILNVEDWGLWIHDFETTAKFIDEQKKKNEMLENLKCCGNCMLADGNPYMDVWCPHLPLSSGKYKQFEANYYCDTWIFDGKTSEERKP